MNIIIYEKHYKQYEHLKNARKKECWCQWVLANIVW